MFRLAREKPVEMLLTFVVTQKFEKKSLIFKLNDCKFNSSIHKTNFTSNQLDSNLANIMRCITRISRILLASQGNTVSQCTVWKLLSHAHVSHKFRESNAMVLLKKSLNSWFDEIFFQRERISAISTLWFEGNFDVRANFPSIWRISL